MLAIYNVKNNLRQFLTFVSKSLSRPKGEILETALLKDNGINKMLVCLPKNKAGKNEHEQTVLGSFIVKNTNVIEVIDKENSIANYNDTIFN